MALFLIFLKTFSDIERTEANSKCVCGGGVFSISRFRFIYPQAVISFSLEKIPLLQQGIYLIMDR